MNVLMAGVGGQGIILASDILANVMLKGGLDVKKSEIHGMAQRGGSVMSHVRFGEKVYSPTIPDGGCDFLLSFEELETARYLDYLNANTRVIINRHRISPPAVIAGKAVYPAIEPLVRGICPDISFVEAGRVAGDIGNPKGTNIILLGVLSACLDVPEEIWIETLNESLKEKIRAVNVEGFRKGRELMSEQLKAV